MSNVVIFGIGRGAEVATRYFRADSPHEIVAYTVDDAYTIRNDFMAKPVIPFSRIEQEALRQGAGCSSRSDFRA